MDADDDLMWHVEHAEAGAVAERLLALGYSAEGADDERLEVLKERLFPRFETLQCPECGRRPKLAAEYFITELVSTLAEMAASLHIGLQRRGIFVDFS